MGQQHPHPVRSLSFFLFIVSASVACLTERIGDNQQTILDFTSTIHFGVCFYKRVLISVLQFVVSWLWQFVVFLRLPVLTSRYDDGSGLSRWWNQGTLECTLKESTTDIHLHIRFREDITVSNQKHVTALQRRALRDHSEDHIVICGRGTEKSIHNHLLALRNATNNAIPEVSTAKVQTGYSTESHTLLSTAKRDFHKGTGIKDDHYIGPYEKLIVSTGKRKFT